MDKQIDEAIEYLSDNMYKTNRHIQIALKAMKQKGKEDRVISVCININGNFLIGRSACRTTESREGECEYRCDDGTIIRHDPDDGAVELAKKMLDTIKEAK